MVIQTILECTRLFGILGPIFHTFWVLKGSLIEGANPQQLWISLY